MVVGRGGRVPDEGLEDVPQDSDEVGWVDDVEGLQVLLVPEREEGTSSEHGTRTRARGLRAVCFPPEPIRGR